MKKVLAIVLTIALLLGCTTAFANTMNVTIVDKDDAGDPTYFHETDDKSKATQKTAMWLRVAAQGQINCTIPLVLVYDTDIDGGTVVTGDAYKITNNSTANIAVTNITVQNYAKNISTDQKPMELVTSNGFSNANAAVDTYCASMTIAKASVHGASASKTLDFHDDLINSDKGKSELATKGGIFFVAAGGSTKVEVTVSTSKLSFVTSMKANEDAQDKTKGVHLLDVVYTVAIDGYSGADAKVSYGEAIQGSNFNGTSYKDGDPSPVKYSYTTTESGTPKTTTTTVHVESAVPTP